MEKTIIRRNNNETAVGDFGQIHPVLQKIYMARGVQSAQEIEHTVKNLLPFHQLLNIEQATQILAQALEAQQRILFIGDYDADGATSCALGVSALRAMGAIHVDYLVPNRFEYGYGLTPEIVQAALPKQPQLMITVDNGISSCEGVAFAKQQGIPVIITDHHLAGERLPDAAAIINPNQPGDLFPSKNLAGVGVIFYVMLALRGYLRQKNWFVMRAIKEPLMTQFLDLVALGTVADVVSLDQNNRILVEQGLQRIRAGLCRAGIKALLQVAGRSYQTIVANDLGFVVAPRLNAAGRLEDMSLGIECLLSKDFYRCQQMAAQLHGLNEQRRRIEKEMEQQALAELDRLHLESAETLPVGLCLFDESWHQGVIGILAARIKERVHRPVIAFALGMNQEIKGSARSIQGLHIRDALDLVATRNPHLISKFGGHAMAAGLTLPKNNFAQFATAFNQVVSELVTLDMLRDQIVSDGELEPAHFTIELAEMLRVAGPWGQHFPQPLFDGQFRLVEQRIVGDKHLRCVLALGQPEQRVEAIAFNVDLEAWPNPQCQFITAAYRLDINEYRGVRSVQLIIEWLQPYMTIVAC